VDIGNALELIDKKLPGWMTWSLLVVLWMALMSAGVHVAYIFVFAPGLRFLANHNFASFVHLSSKIWIDIFVMIGVLVFILIVSVFSAILVVWFLIAAFIAPIFKAFQRKPKVEEASVAEKPAPLDILSGFSTPNNLDEA